MRGVLPTLTLALALSTSACGGTPERAVDPVPTADPTIVPSFRLPDRGPVEPRQALSLVPVSAEVLVLTDWDEVRARFGFNDLTSGDLMTDRFAFWEQAGREAVLLGEGLLRPQNSVFELDYGFTQDDVDWEARFTGPEGAGYVLAFRPDQDMAEVGRAVADEFGPLSGATVLPGRQLVVSGVAEHDEPVWALGTMWRDLVDDTAETTYLHRGCLPVNESLGPDATAEDQAPLTDLVARLEPLAAFSVTFAGQVVTARLGPDRPDLHRRADLSAAWPSEVGFNRAFTGMQVADPASGRIGLRIDDPGRVAALTLTGGLPFAVCDEIVPLTDPTGP